MTDRRRDPRGLSTCSPTPRRNGPKSVYGRALLIAAIALIGAGAARADDIVHVGKAQATAWTFLPVDIGIAQGLFAKHKINFVPAHPDVKTEASLAEVLKGTKIFAIDDVYAGANRKRIVDRWVAEVLP